MDRRTFVKASASAAVLPLLKTGTASAAGGRYSSGFSILPAGAIMPGGWIKEQMRRDLVEGITGRYDLVSDTVNKDRFGASKIFDTLKNDNWWNGEHEGYWKEAVTRTAFLVGDHEYQAKVKGWMERILQYQAPDGYIGVYGPDIRLKQQNDNGELWTQARILMAMIAYSEFTGDTAVFDAARRSVALNLRTYGPDHSYFKGGGGSSAHGMAYADVLEYLWRITGDEEIKNFADFLYLDFDRYGTNPNDCCLHKLLDPDLKFFSHGVHVVEHFMIPFFLADIVGRPDYVTAARNAWRKLDYHNTPSGAIVSNEDVRGRPGTAWSSYEYCCITHMVTSLNRVMETRGLTAAADLVERLVFNAGQAGRLPVLTALSYCTRDNRRFVRTSGNGYRDPYWPTHGAACCTLNGGRLMPYFVEGMWMKKDDGLAAIHYGPCTLTTTVKGVPVKLEEKTDYPFSDAVTLAVEPESPVEFDLWLRVPGFGTKMEVEAAGARVERPENFVRLGKTWSKGDAVTIKMQHPVIRTTDRAQRLRPTGDYLQRGPLLYSALLPARAVPTKPVGTGVFHEYEIVGEGGAGWDWRLPQGAEFGPAAVPDADLLHPWDRPAVALEGEMKELGCTVSARLVPIGNTILRRTTFPRW